MGAITDARDDVAAALASTGVRVYKVAPEVPVAPCYVLVPAQPWIEPERIGSGWRYSVTYQVQCVVDARINETAMAKLEDMVEDAAVALQKIAIVESASQPQLVDIGNQGQVYTTAVTCAVHAT